MSGDTGGVGGGINDNDYSDTESSDVMMINSILDTKTNLKLTNPPVKVLVYLILLDG